MFSIVFGFFRGLRGEYHFSGVGGLGPGRYSRLMRSSSSSCFFLFLLAAIFRRVCMIALPNFSPSSFLPISQGVTCMRIYNRKIIAACLSRPRSSSQPWLEPLACVSAAAREQARSACEMPCRLWQGETVRPTTSCRLSTVCGVQWWLPA